MPRSARKHSEADIYHVIDRGVNQSLIFEDDVDRKHFLALLVELFEEEGVELYCWCLLGNHFHLLVHAGIGSLSKAMSRLLTKYAIYFNSRHGRLGYLFQGRFGTEAVNDDSYLLAVVRYIHWNPVKAGLSKTCRFRWSSYNEYLGDKGICATARVLDIFGGVEVFRSFHEIEPTEKCLDIVQPKKRIGDAEMIELVEAEFGKDVLKRVAGMSPVERNGILRKMKGLGASIRQVQRLTGVGKNIVERA